jgi:hypothetical protein
MKSDIESEKNEAFKNKIKWNERFISCPVCRETIKQNLLDDLDRFYENYATNDQKNIINNKLSNQSYPDDTNIKEMIVISSRMRKLQNEVF